MIYPSINSDFNIYMYYGQIYVLYDVDKNKRNVNKDKNITYYFLNKVINTLYVINNNIYVYYNYDPDLYLYNKNFYFKFSTKFFNYNNDIYIYNNNYIYLDEHIMDFNLNIINKTINFNKIREKISFCLNNLKIYKLKNYNNKFGFNIHYNKIYVYTKNKTSSNSIIIFNFENDNDIIFHKEINFGKIRIHGKYLFIQDNIITIHTNNSILTYNIDN